MPIRHAPPGSPLNGEPARRPSQPGTPIGRAATQPAELRSAGSRRLASLVGPAARATSVLDGRLLRLASQPIQASTRLETMLEMALCAQLRTGLRAYAEEAPAKPAAQEPRIDAVLAESVLTAVEHALAVVSDLDADPSRHAERLLGHVRLCASELVALGQDAAAAKSQCAALSLQLAKGGLSAAPAVRRGAAELWAELALRLEEICPRQAKSLLDLWLLPAASAQGLSPGVAARWPAQPSSLPVGAKS